MEELHNDLKQICNKYHIKDGSLRYNKIFYCFKSVLKTPKISDKFGILYCYHEWLVDVEMVQKIMKKEYPHIYKNIRHGDMLCMLNCEVIFFFFKKGNDFKLIPSNDGEVPTVFKTFEEFPPKYWYDCDIFHIDEEGYDECVDEDEDFFPQFSSCLVPISKKIRKRIGVLNKNVTNTLERNSQISFIDNLKNYELYSYFRFKNTLYIFYNDKYKNYIVKPEFTCNLPSRWGVVKACVKLLSSQKRAVERVNHPDRLKLSGVFQDLE